MVSHLPSTMPTQGTRLRRRKVVACAALLLIAVAAALHARSLIQGTPDWWQFAVPPSSRNPATRANAQDVEHAIVAQLTYVRATPEPWSVSMSRRDACDWLAARFPQWLTHQELQHRWPASLGTVRVAFEEERLYAGAMVRHNGQDMLIWALLKPKLDDAGALWLPAERIGIGKLSLPRDAALARLTHAHEDPQDDLVSPQVRADPAFASLLRILEGKDPALRQAIVKVDDARRVRLLALRASQGRLVVSAQTEWLGPRQSSSQTSSPSAGHSAP
jgi:hypothetical protein